MFIKIFICLLNICCLFLLLSKTSSMMLFLELYTVQRIVSIIMKYVDPKIDLKGKIMVVEKWQKYILSVLLILLNITNV